MNKVQLFGDRVYAVFDAIQEEKTKGGIILPDQHKERSRIATIVDVGPDVVNYKIGDRIIVSTYTGVRLHLVGEELFGTPVHEDTHRILREEEILCKLVEG